MSKNTKNYLPKFLLFFVVLSVLLAIKAASASEKLVYIHFLDVGQGDAILFETPDGFQMLVDGGPNDKVLESLRRVMPIGDRTIDWLVLSHGDADHLGGLLDVIREYQVQSILMPDVPKETKLYAEWLQLIENEGAAVYYSVDRRQYFINDLFQFETLHPTAQTTKKGMGPNDLSIVMHLAVGQVDLLLTGDIEAMTEEQLVVFSDPVDTEILKVPHHGSNSSSTPAFLTWVEPEIAVIQAGRQNRYGHPHEEVLARYESFHVPVFRTDQLGTVSLATDGQTIYRATPQIEVFPQLFGFRLETVYTVPNH